MIFSLITLPAPLYWSLILALLAGVVFVAYLLGSTPRPAPVRPFYRRLLLMLPFLAMAVQVEMSDQGKAAIVIVQWRR